MNLYEFDHSHLNEKIKTVAGMDEAGRGPLAGPVVAAVVILPHDFHMDSIKDSKKISEKKRAILYDEILKNAIDYGIGICHEDEIDHLNILQATFKAMKKAIGQLNTKPDLILIDGLKGQINYYNCKYIVKGDSKSQSIAAASIVAKVSRDKYMIEYEKIFPEYGFEKHKGYGTKFHIKAIKKYKSSPIHRKSFKPIRNYLPTYASYNTNLKLKKLAVQIASSVKVKNNFNILEIYKNRSFDILHIEKHRIVLSKVKLILNENIVEDEYKLNYDDIEREMIFLEKKLKEDIQFDVISIQLSKSKPIITIKKNVNIK